MTVLHYAGVGLFAEVARIDEEWPRAQRAAATPSSCSAFVPCPTCRRRWRSRRCDAGPANLKAHNGRLIVSGVTPAAARILQRGGLDEILGEDGIVPAGEGS